MAGKTARDSPRIYLVLSPVPECLKRAMKLKERSFAGHLSTTVIFFWQTVHACTLVSTSLQWPLSSVPKVAVVKRFNCRWRWSGEVVRHCFFLNIQEKATNEKFILEEAQRKGHKERRETGEEWIPKLFERDPAAPNAINRWVYKYREWVRVLLLLQDDRGRLKGFFSD